MTRDGPPNGTEESALIRANISVSGWSPPLEVPDEIIGNIEETDTEAIVDAVIEWWDDLDRNERAKMLNLEECDGQALRENLLFIDRIDGERNHSLDSDSDSGSRPVFNGSNPIL